MSSRGASIIVRAEQCLERMEKSCGPIDPVKRVNYKVILVGLIGDERIAATTDVASALIDQLNGQVHRASEAVHDDGEPHQ